MSGKSIPWHPLAELFQAEKRFETIARKLREGIGTKHGGAALEHEYGQAYEKLVELGVRPSLRTRYRG